MRWLDNITMRNKLILLLFLPCAMLLGFVFQSLTSNYNLLNHLHDEHELFLYFNKLNSVSDSLLTEAEASFHYIISKGSTSTKEISDTRQRTDSALILAKEFFESSDFLGSSHTLKLASQKMFNSVDLLNQKRAAIDSLTLSPEEARNFYFGIEGDFLQIMYLIEHT